MPLPELKTWTSHNQAHLYTGFTQEDQEPPAILHRGPYQLHGPELGESLQGQSWRRPWALICCFQPGSNLLVCLLLVLTTTGPAQGCAGADAQDRLSPSRSGPQLPLTEGSHAAARYSPAPAQCGTDTPRKRNWNVITKVTFTFLSTILQWRWKWPNSWCWRRSPPHSSALVSPSACSCSFLLFLTKQAWGQQGRGASTSRLHGFSYPKTLFS